MSAHAPSPTAPLTRVAILFLPDRANDWLRFGTPVAERKLDRRRAVASFAAGAIFGYVRWRANGFGTELWRAYVLRAGAPGDTLQTVPGIAPAADILVSTATEARVRRLLALIGALEVAGVAPQTAPESYWRVVQNRIAAGARLRLYAADELAATRRARELAP